MSDHASSEERGVLASWKASFEGHSSARDLPAHHAQCLGCGPDNPHAHHLVARRDGARVVANHEFDARHMGAPGIAHGGAVATVLDDLYGYLLYVVGTLGVTRTLEVEYLSPVRLNQPYDLSAELRQRDGRKLHMRAAINGPSGTVAQSRALFIAVDIEHFESARAGRGVER